MALATMNIPWKGTTEVEGSNGVYDIWDISIYRNGETGQSYWAIIDKWDHMKLFGQDTCTLEEAKVQCAEEIGRLTTVYPKKETD